MRANLRIALTAVVLSAIAPLVWAMDPEVPDPVPIRPGDVQGAPPFVEVPSGGWYYLPPTPTGGGGTPCLCCDEPCCPCCGKFRWPAPPIPEPGSGMPRPWQASVQVSEYGTVNLANGNLFMAIPLVEVGEEGRDEYG